eukprot:TRINITY_DN733_c0_g1_i2.p1 TRINITY_DN733_c0_g1~~TRINITY_DN733_c0_g1_i2.p1  ORF type:complete len:123 (-),score=22.59 TRINITY_DN733_c0_g1_i2:45-413(-)
MERNREHWDKACVHCFTGTETELLKYLDMGFYIGITGWVCDTRRGQGLRDIVHHIPLDRIMIETDSPYLKPHNVPRELNVRRNEPCLLPFVLTQLAESMGVTPQELAEASTRNTIEFFNLQT